MNNNKVSFTFPCFTYEQVKEINKKIKENIFQEEEKSDVARNTSKIGKFSNVQCLPLMELIHPWLYECQMINKRVFGYDIHWDFHLDILNYNEYGIEGEYDWHIDSSGEAAPIDMKLTCILNLSEESYEGGEFYTSGSKQEIKFNSGETLIMNSMLMHKITPITKGKRITLTYWASGPAWR